MHSIEGERGMPRPRPPYPVGRGPLRTSRRSSTTSRPGPTSRSIILDGADWFASIGTEKSKGTKVFALAGKVDNTGLIEVPMGTTLREIIFDIGGGIPDGKRVQGRPDRRSVRRLPARAVPRHAGRLRVARRRPGSIMGSGGMIVMDEDTCMVDIAKFFLEFTQDESCGKCTPCREGTKRMLEILTRITEGKGEAGDIEKLERLGNMIKKASLCGLGQSAPNPVLSDHQELPRGIRRAHQRQEVPGRSACKLPRIVRNQRQVRRLRGLQKGLPGRARSPAAPRTSTRSIRINASGAACA